MNLKIITLKLIEKEEKSGYDIIKSLSQDFGMKAGAGSIYPILDSLHKEEFATVSKEGRRKIYKITAKGLEHLKGFDEKKEEIFEQISGGVKLAHKLYGVEDEGLDFALQQMKGDKCPFGSATSDVIKFRIALFKAFNKGETKRIKEVLEKTTKELNKI